MIRECLSFQLRSSCFMSLRSISWFLITSSWARNAALTASYVISKDSGDIIRFLLAVPNTIKMHISPVKAPKRQNPDPSFSVFITSPKTCTGSSLTKQGRTYLTFLGRISNASKSCHQTKLQLRSKAARCVYIATAATSASPIVSGELMAF
jgi:hypothetical protein